MRESLLEKQCCTWAKNRGWLVYKFTSPGNAGVPDRIFIRKGIVVFVEFKSKYGKLNATQRYQIECLIKQEMIILVIKDFNIFKNMLKKTEV